MKNTKEKTDLLLEQNTAEQLKLIDWNELNAAISNRLDKAESAKSPRKYKVAFRLTAGFIAAAAVLLAVIMLKVDRPENVNIPTGRFAAVEFVKNKSTVTVEIKQTVHKTLVSVDITPNKARMAKCEVEIIDYNGYSRQQGSRAVWMIITRPQPKPAATGLSRDEIDWICML